MERTNAEHALGFLTGTPGRALAALVPRWCRGAQRHPPCGWRASKLCVGRHAPRSSRFAGEGRAAAPLPWTRRPWPAHPRRQQRSSPWRRPPRPPWRTSPLGPARTRRRWTFSSWLPSRSWPSPALLSSGRARRWPTSRCAPAGAPSHGSALMAADKRRPACQPVQLQCPLLLHHPGWLSFDRFVGPAEEGRRRPHAAAHALGAHQGLRGTQVMSSGAAPPPRLCFSTEPAPRGRNRRRRGRPTRPAGR